MADDTPPPPIADGGDTSHLPPNFDVLLARGRVRLANATFEQDMRPSPFLDAINRAAAEAFARANAVPAGAPASPAAPSRPLGAGPDRPTEPPPASAGLPAPWVEAGLDLDEELSPLQRRLLDWWMSNAAGRASVPLEEMALPVWGKDMEDVTADAVKAALRPLNRLLGRTAAGWTLHKHGRNVRRH